MSRKLILLLSVMLSACSSGPVAKLTMESGVPVVYPARASQHEPLVEAYGPTFRSVAADYPDYQFN